MISLKKINDVTDAIAFYMLSAAIFLNVIFASYVIPRFINPTIPESKFLCISVCVVLFVFVIKYNITIVLRIFKQSTSPFWAIVVDKPHFHERWASKVWWPLLVTPLSYLITIYGFGVIYFTLYRFNDKLFNVTTKPMTFFDSIYFSFVTASTVGYGDISPALPVAKFIVVLEIIFHLYFSVIIFSAISAYVLTTFKDSKGKA